jgi:cellulose biosynthesis protein BcsQ
MNSFDIDFNKTKLTSKELVYLFDCSPTTINRWAKTNIIHPVEIPYINSNINSYTFSDAQIIRQNSYKKSLNFNKKILSFFTIKGGVAKTTTSSQLIYLLALMGFKVLAIDLDHQMDLTVSLGMINLKENKSMYDVLIDDVPIKDSIIEVNPNLHVIAGNEKMDNLDYEFFAFTNKEKAIHNQLEKIKDDYDIIIIDTHPAKTPINSSIMYASDGIIIPTTSDYLGYRGVDRVFKQLEYMKGSDLENTDYEKFIRIIPVRYKKVRKIEQTYLAELNKEYLGMVLSPIKDSALIAKATDFSLSIFNIKKSLNKVETMEDYQSLSDGNLFIGLNYKTEEAQQLKTLAEELLTFMRE